MLNLAVILLAVLFLLALLTLLRIRVKLGLYPNVKTLFVGLGNSGIRIDISGKKSSIILAGRTIRTRSIKAKTIKQRPEAKIKTSKRKRFLRSLPFKQVVAVIPNTIKAFWDYFFSILKSAAIEEFDGEINAGFGPPDITGMAFGFYQATLAGIPGIDKRFKYIPDWNGLSFQGQLRLSVSIPLYRVLFRTMVVAWQLPLRDLLKLAIGTKKAMPEAMPKGK